MVGGKDIPKMTENMGVDVVFPRYGITNIIKELSDFVLSSSVKG